MPSAKKYHCERVSSLNTEQHCQTFVKQGSHVWAGAAHLLDHIVQVEGAAAVAAAAGPPPVAARPEAALLCSLSSQA